MADIRKIPKPQTAWGYYNWGRLWGTAGTRRAAVANVEKIMGMPWNECRKSCEVHKVIVEKRP